MASFWEVYFPLIFWVNFFLLFQHVMWTFVLNHHELFKQHWLKGMSHNICCIIFSLLQFVYLSQVQIFWVTDTSL